MTGLPYKRPMKKGAAVVQRPVIQFTKLGLAGNLTFDTINIVIERGKQLTIIQVLPAGTFMLPALSLIGPVKILFLPDLISAAALAAAAATSAGIFSNGLSTR